MRHSNNLRSVTLLLLVLSAASLPSGCSRSKKQVAAHTSAQTTSDMKQVRDSLLLYTADMRRIPWKGDTNLPAKALFEVLTSQTNKMVYLAENKRWVQAGSLTDPWGNDYHIQVLLAEPVTTNVSKVLKYRVSMWSNGPNELDDHQKKDDIVLESFEIQEVN